MINTQLPELRAPGDGSLLEVHSIFKTIQGEGPFSGHPAIFIRLAGCNLQCPGCDTEYTAIRDRLQLSEIVQRIGCLETNYNLCVVTGGEPLRQDINKLLITLSRIFRHVQIETNGTYAPLPGFPGTVRIVCSPKAGKVADGLLHHVDAYKYVLDHRAVSIEDGLPISILGKDLAPARPPKGYRGKIYVTPMDLGEGHDLNSSYNRQAAADVCMKFGYILNLQIHKLVNLP